MRKCYTTDRMMVRLADPEFADMTAEFFFRNRKMLERYEERVRRSFFARSFKRSGWTSKGRTQEKGEWYSYYLFEKRKPHTVIGTLSLSRIQYGNLCSGVLGYRIGGERQGEGFGTEAAKEGTRIGFEELSLHRMEADVMTENRASLRILEKCGYKKEGYFREYFRINGKWEDHIHMAAIRA